MISAVTKINLVPGNFNAAISLALLHKELQVLMLLLCHGIVITYSGTDYMLRTIAYYSA